jgi:hypothetical protein
MPVSLTLSLLKALLKYFFFYGGCSTIVSVAGDISHISDDQIGANASPAPRNLLFSTSFKSKHFVQTAKDIWMGANI